MTYELKLEEKPRYLHAVVTGRNTKESIARYLEELLQLCIARNCERLLVEERLDGPRLRNLDVFEIAAAVSRRAVGQFKALAFVDVNGDAKQMRFAETVAVNRSIPVRVFETVAEAEAWLQSTSDGQPKAEEQQA